MKRKRTQQEEGDGRSAVTASRAGNPAGAVSSASFSDLGCLSGGTISCLTALGFTHATPVQEATLPLFCGNKDVAVEACTGSGKTLAFVVPVVERLRRLSSPLSRHQVCSTGVSLPLLRVKLQVTEQDRKLWVQVGAIIVSPTRELANQTFAVLAPFLESNPDLHATLLVGGRSAVSPAPAMPHCCPKTHVAVGSVCRDAGERDCSVSELTLSLLVQ